MATSDALRGLAPAIVDFAVGAIEVTMQIAPLIFGQPAVAPVRPAVLTIVLAVILTVVALRRSLTLRHALGLLGLLGLLPLVCAVGPSPAIVPARPFPLHVHVCSAAAMAAPRCGHGRFPREYRECEHYACKNFHALRLHAEKRVRLVMSALLFCSNPVPTSYPPGMSRHSRPTAILIQCGPILRRLCKPIVSSALIFVTNCCGGALRTRTLTEKVELGRSNR